MGHTRHQSLTTTRSYVRRAKLRQANSAGKLGSENKYYKKWLLPCFFS